jgi:hypothetical protein
MGALDVAQEAVRQHDISEMRNDMNRPSVRAFMTPMHRDRRGQGEAGEGTSCPLKVGK